MLKIWKLCVMTSRELDQLRYQSDYYKSYWALWETEHKEETEGAEEDEASPEESV